MTIRIAAIEVSHWHAVYDAAYLRHLVAMPDVELVAVQDTDAGLVAKRAAEVGNPATFTDYRQMLTSVRPDFVVALGRHCQMAGIAHDLLEQGYPFLMEKPMGINAAEVEAVAAKAERLNAFVAVPLAQRYGPFAARARELLAAGRFGPLSHIYVRINRPGPARYPAWDCAWMLDPAEAGGGCLRNLGSHGLDMFLHLTGETAQVTGAQLSRRAHERAVEDYASVMLRSGLGLQPNVDPERLGLYGTSYGGATVVWAGAVDPRVRCIVSVVALTPHSTSCISVVHSPFRLASVSSLGCGLAIPTDTIHRTPTRPPSLSSSSCNSWRCFGSSAPVGGHGRTGSLGLA